MIFVAFRNLQIYPRREKIMTRLERLCFRLEMAKLERLGAIVSTHRDGMSVWEIAKEKKWAFPLRWQYGAQIFAVLRISKII